jgi:hypothetical protein
MSVLAVPAVHCCLLLTHRERRLPLPRCPVPPGRKPHDMSRTTAPNSSHRLRGTLQNRQVRNTAPTTHHLCLVNELPLRGGNH